VNDDNSGYRTGCIGRKASTVPSPATRLAVAGHQDQRINGRLGRGANGIGSESGCPDICLSVKKTDELRPWREFFPFDAFLSGQPSGTSTENRPIFMKAGVLGMIPAKRKLFLVTKL
jgi:hypothetical protein